MAEPIKNTGARFGPLDWLRGLLAASIMFYHLISWDLPHLDASTLLGRLGVYGVSMFFLLSGLSIAIAYDRHLGSWAGVGSFALRRMFRIWPMMWLAAFAMTALLVARDEGPSWKFLLLNLTTLFGFIKPTAYLGVGAWSIGNEMVYFSLTPLIVLLYRRNLQLGNAVLLATLGIVLLFAFRWLIPSTTLGAQWSTYVNPFNNLFLSTAGIALHYNATSPAWPKWKSFSAMAIALGVFALYPVEGDQALIVTGWNRLAFSAAAVLLVLSFFKSSFHLVPALARPLTQLGLATYGVYLLHPLIRELARLLLPGTGIAVLLPTTVVATVLVSWSLYHGFELPIMRRGKQLTERKGMAKYAS